jgi:hypothetical protein
VKVEFPLEACSFWAEKIEGEEQAFEPPWRPFAHFGSIVGSQLPQRFVVGEFVPVEDP